MREFPRIVLPIAILLRIKITITFPIFPIISFLILLLFLLPPNVYADVPESQKDEVEHLLNFIKSTECIVERNGKRHTGEESYSHIMKKYNYFRDKIHTTEEFIEFSATKSTMSGEFYMVCCDGKRFIPTRDWLLQELSNYRKRYNTEASGK